MNERTNGRACSVTNCLALAIDGLTCPPHIHAVMVTSTMSARNQSCLECARKIKKGEWIWREMRRKTGKRPGDTYGWAHVACEPIVPRVSRQELRDAPKPLLDTTVAGTDREDPA